MKRQNSASLRYAMFIWGVTTALAVLINCSPEKGKDGPNGQDGRDGESCSVTQLENGAEIKCAGGTTAVVLNGPVGPKGDKGDDGSDGKDGKDLAPGAYSVVEVIDPCGKQAVFDEVILRLANGQLLAHYSDGSKQFFALLGPGNYQTTDGTQCRFSVTSNLTIQ